MLKFELYTQMVSGVRYVRLPSKHIIFSQMLAHCWPTVHNAVPAVIQHWANIYVFTRLVIVNQCCDM